MRLSGRPVCFAALFLVSTGAICGAQNADARIPVVLSTDVGNEIDDQWAITYLLLQPRFEVLGVMSAHAPSISAPAGQTSCAFSSMWSRIVWGWLPTRHSSKEGVFLGEREDAAHEPGCSLSH